MSYCCNNNSNEIALPQSNQIDVHSVRLSIEP